MNTVAKPSMILLGVLALGGMCDSLAAQEALLLVSKDGRYAITKADATGLHEVASTASRSTYGESRDRLAILSRRDADASALEIYDKRTLRLLSSWPVPGLPASQLSGGSREIVLDDQFAYFVSVRYTPEGPRTGPGITPFDFHRLSVADGTLQTMPVPVDCKNPRLVDVKGVPFLYAWNGENVWRYDLEASKFVQVVSNDDLDESFTTTAPGIPQSDLPRFADYLLLYDGSIFRLSREGTVKQILQSDLRPPTDDRRSVSVRRGGKVIRLYAGRLSKRPVVGVLQQLPGDMLFFLVDATSKAQQWSATLPQSVAPDSLVIASDGSIFYVDTAVPAVFRASAEGTRLVWKLNSDGANVDGHGTRIVWVMPGRSSSSTTE